VNALLLRLKPVLFVLFGAGILVGTLLLPGYLMTIGLAGPLGLLPAEALSFERAQAIFSNPLGRLLLLGLIVLPLLKGAYDTPSLAVDLSSHHVYAPLSALLYGVAALGSVLGVLTVLWI
jgi:fumarate reductase subunit D